MLLTGESSHKVVVSKAATVNVVSKNYPLVKVASRPVTVQKVKVRGDSACVSVSRVQRSWKRRG